MKRTVEINAADVLALRLMFERADEDWQNNRQYFTNKESAGYKQSIDRSHKRVAALIQRAMEVTGKRGAE